MKSRQSQHAFLFTIFHRLSQYWNLTEKEQLDLLNVKSAEILSDFEIGRKVPPEELFRTIGYLWNIYISLRTLLPDEHSANTWIRRKNYAKLFSGKPAIEIMLSGSDGIKKVRDYLLGEIGGPF